MRASLVGLLLVLFGPLACDGEPAPAIDTTPDATDDAPADVTAETHDASFEDSAEVETGETVAPPPCLTTAPTSCPDPAPSWPDVEPIIAERCLGCHYGKLGGPWPLTSYDHVSDWRDTIRSVMLDCSMPPPEEHSAMTTAERMQLLVWIRCGLPR